MKIKINIAVVVICLLTVSAVIFYGCSKSYLEAEPYGQYGTDQIKNKKGVVALL